MSVYITFGDPSGCMGTEFIDSDKHPDNMAVAKKAKAIAAKAAKSQRSMSSSWETIDTYTGASTVRPAPVEPPLIYVPQPNESIMDIIRSVLRLHTAR